jgi:flagellar basal-body rod modification protein FlgD
MAFPIVPVLGAVTAAIGALTAKKAETPARLGKDDFLKLLVAQLKNQNPLNPLSNDQLISQSTQFSTLEELQNIRKGMDTVAGASGGSAVASATALVGRSVTATSAGFTYAGATVSLPFTLPVAAARTVLEITDANGAVVSHVELGARQAGGQAADFQPAAAGRVLPAGQYRYRILTVDSTGRFVPVPAITGGVTGVVLEGNAPVLTLGSRRVALSDVVGVGGTN